jgi:hypothetical protein
MNNIFSYIDENVCHGYDDRNNILVIKEEDISSKIKKVFISTPKNNIFAFKLDCKTTGCISNYISKSKDIEGIRSGCDCILFVEKETWKGVVFIELKSNTIKNKDLLNKFKSSKAFVTYLQTLYNEFNDDFYKIDHIQYVLFCTKPIGNSNPRTPIVFPISENIYVKRFYVPETKGEGFFNLDSIIG